MKTHLGFDAKVLVSLMCQESLQEPLEKAVGLCLLQPGLALLCLKLREKNC